MQRKPFVSIHLVRFAGGLLGAVATLAAVAVLTNNGAGIL
jgi:hypothetical protein